MSPPRRSLVEVSSGDLKDVLTAVRGGRLSFPLRLDHLSVEGFTHCAADLAGALEGLDHSGAAAAVEAVLSERSRPTPKVELVWTGPDPDQSQARDTWVVVRELFASARRAVLVAGYTFDHGKDILRPLHEVMKEHGVRADLYVDIPGATPGKPRDDTVREAVEAFLQNNWPWTGPRPTLYYDPRPFASTDYSSLHAKCIVVDERLALVTSANFTSRGQTRNIEVGARIEDEHFAKALVGQWRAATDRGLFVRYRRDGGGRP